jgi:Protein tyrosine kinase.
MKKILLVPEKAMSMCADVFSLIYIYTLHTALKCMKSFNYRYKVMTSCWNEVPSERPSFKELTMTFEQMLEDGVDYLDLNPYIGHDRTYCASPRDILGKYIGYPRRKCTS